MSDDRIRRVLVVLVLGLLFIPAALFSQQVNPSPMRKGWLSSVSGTVMVTPPGAAEWVKAQVDTPIEEGSEVSTLDASDAHIDLENGATVHLNELTQAKFTQLTMDAGGNKLTVVTLEQGHADFQFAPEHQDVYKVKIADATLSPHGKTEFQTHIDAGKVWVDVVEGSVVVAAGASALTLGKGKFLEYRPSPDAEVAKSHARVVRLSYVEGTVTVKRPGAAEAEPAMLNTPIQEGFELATSNDSYVEVEFENDSTARLGEQSKMLFQQLALDADGNKLNGITFEQGYATFHFLPTRSSPSSDIRHGKDGTIYFQPSYLDVSRVKIADATLTAVGKCEFRTDMDQDRFRVEVFSGAVDMATSTFSSQLGEGRTLEHQSGGTELAFSIRKGIVKDAWDKWTEARDKQVLLTEKNEAFRPTYPCNGWSDLNTYGEWVGIPGSGYGWSPYARAGWSPYTNGRWDWYSGFGWTWISGEPWGWLTDHHGEWNFDPTFGWYWMNSMFGCGPWEPALVDWYGGRGWIGWRPRHPGPGLPRHPHPGPPGHPRPSPGPHPGQPPREIVTVPTTAFQSRQSITPQILSNLAPLPGTRIEAPPFEPNPRPASTATESAPSVGTLSQSNNPAAPATPASAPISRAGSGFASHHGSAPSTILMGGDPAKESSLLAMHNSHIGHAPLRAAEGLTLGGRYAVRGSPGEFRGNASGGKGRNGNTGGVNGPTGGPILSRSGGGSVTVMGHGQGGGGSRGGGFSGGGRSGGGGSSGGGHSGGGGGYSGGGGGGSSGGGHAGGGGGFSGGGGGGGHH